MESVCKNLALINKLLNNPQIKFISIKKIINSYSMHSFFFLELCYRKLKLEKNFFGHVFFLNP